MPVENHGLEIKKITILMKNKNGKWQKKHHVNHLIITHFQGYIK